MNTIYLSSLKRKKKTFSKIINPVVEFGIFSVGGCGGQTLHSKFILKVVSQMVGFCEYATVLFSYLHIGFLTFLALLKIYFWDETPYTQKILTKTFVYMFLRKIFDKKLSSKSFDEKCVSAYLLTYVLCSKKM